MVFALHRLIFLLRLDSCTRLTKPPVSSLTNELAHVTLFYSPINLRARWSVFIT